ncbi:hypothetical protein [Alkalisalibacterium limincola]|uniref:Uncharacterized protein n=1 Tax=Alkalisalibacterium limincola TaxID=2699169 RepID=A0A5C8KU93_9GAMM|nr:hypothetical protein [Alkalisalibacterium limincola]TXK64451.1 hypothetical protein FU658_06050 [Alkalisalibacterium limincola]
MQPWRILVVAVVVALHAAVLVHVTRPPSSDSAPAALVRVDRIQLVEIAPPPPPLPVRRPQRPAPGPSAAPADARAGALQVVAAPADEAGGVAGAPAAGADQHAAEERPADAQATFARPSAGARPLREPGRQHLPGRDEAFVEGFHVREAPSLEDRVLGAAAMLFGGGRPETCDDVRQRLIGAGPGLARDMDVERLRRLCTN